MLIDWCGSWLPAPRSPSPVWGGWALERQWRDGIGVCCMGVRKRGWTHQQIETRFQKCCKKKKMLVNVRILLNMLKCWHIRFTKKGSENINKRVKDLLCMCVCVGEEQKKRVQWYAYTISPEYDWTWSACCCRASYTKRAAKLTSNFPNSAMPR